MSSTEGYINQCVEVAGAIDRSALSQLEIGSQIGESGKHFVMRSLGHLSIQEVVVPVGVKIPRKIHDYSASDLITLRFQAEQESICLLTERMPELVDEVPKFIAMVSVGQKSPIALLTEDATATGHFPISPMHFMERYPSDLASSIEEAFIGDSSVFVDKDVINESMQFAVGEKRRLLDFTPPPVGFKTVDGGEELRDRISEAIFERLAVVDVDSDSPFGQSLAGHIQ